MKLWLTPARLTEKPGVWTEEEEKEEEEAARLESAPFFFFFFSFFLLFFFLNFQLRTKSQSFFQILHKKARIYSVKHGLNSKSAVGQMQK